MTTSAAAPPRVLFVCTGNTCRSVLAEYLARERFRDAIIVESAGVRPQSAADAENAVYTLRKNFGIDASMHKPRDIRSLDLAEYDLVIALDKHVTKVVLELGVPSSKIKVWSVRDPWGPDLSEYDRASVAIKRKLAQLEKTSHSDKLA